MFSLIRNKRVSRTRHCRDRLGRNRRRLAFEPMEPRLLLKGGPGGDAVYVAIDLDKLDGSDVTSPVALNNQADVQVLGDTFVDTGSGLVRGPCFYWDGAIHQIPLAVAGTACAAEDINDQGIALVQMTATDGTLHSFVSKSGWAAAQDLGPHTEFPEDINEGGAVVGWGTNADGDRRPFVVDPIDVDGDGDLEWFTDTGFGGAIADDGINDLRIELPPLDPSHDVVEAYSINANGDVVGRSGSFVLREGLRTRAAIWEKTAGGYVVNDVTSGTEFANASTAFFLNNEGNDALGLWLNPSDDEYHAMFWDGAGLYDLGIRGGGQKSSLNDNGQMVTKGLQTGVYFWEKTNPPMEPLLLDGVTRFGAGLHPDSNSMNNLGQVVGPSVVKAANAPGGGGRGRGGQDTEDTLVHGFLWEASTRETRDLNDLTSRGTSEINVAVGINDLAQIIATNEENGLGLLLVTAGDRLASLAGTSTDGDRNSSVLIAGTNQLAGNLSHPGAPGNDGQDAYTGQQPVAPIPEDTDQTPIPPQSLSALPGPPPADLVDQVLADHDTSILDEPLLTQLAVAVS